jgi:hypothetical protein
VIRGSTRGQHHWSWLLPIALPEPNKRGEHGAGPGFPALSARGCDPDIRDGSNDHALDASVLPRGS